MPIIYGGKGKFIPSIGGGAVIDPLATLLTKFVVPGDEVAVGLRIQTVTTYIYYLYQHLGSQRYWRIAFNGAVNAEDENTADLSTAKICKLFRAYNHLTTPAITWGPQSWSWAYVGAPGFITGYLAGQEGVVAQYVDITMPAETEDISYLGMNTATGCVFLVTIDGDRTLANLLPTAQDLVDATTLPNTVLVANGGQFNPTDRVLNTYNLTVNFTNDIGNSGAIVPLASGLAAAAHTVRLTDYQYTPTGAGGHNAYVVLLLASGDGLNVVADGSSYNCFTVVQNFCTIGETWDISYAMTPDGATHPEWLGHVNSTKYVTTPVINVDGSPVVLASGEYASGTDVTLTYQAWIRHSEIGGGATHVGTLDMEYAINALTGLTITHKTTWGMSGVANGYPCMMVVDHAVFDRFRGLDTVATDLTANDGSVNCNTTKQASLCWDYNGYIGAVMYIPDLVLTVESWAKSGANQLWWSDIAADSGTWKKLYATRFGSAENFINGTVWDAVTNYRAAWFASGADAELA
jgi:hypothetical protein